jgi:hypothetical protein
MPLQSQGVLIRRQSSVAGTPATMSTNTISFTNADKAINRQAGFADFSTGMRIECDASLNSGVFTIVGTAATKLTVREVIAAQASGADITLTGYAMQNIGRITAFNGFGQSANVIDITDINSTGKEKMTGLIGGGDLSISVIYEPEASGAYLHDALMRDMAARTKRVFDITFNDASVNGYPSFAYFEGYVQSYSITGAVDNVLRADMTITISTGIDWQNAT